MTTPAEMLLPTPKRRRNASIVWRWSRNAALVLAFAYAAGCTTALPVLSGGSTTPHYRKDIGLGGAARIGFGEMKRDFPDNANESHYGNVAESGGVVPVGLMRFGLRGGHDIGVLISGTTARLDWRKERVLQDGVQRSTFMFGLSPYGGWIVERGDRGQGGRAGLELPLLFGIDFGSVAEVWCGARISSDIAWGDFELGGSKSNATNVAVRSGAVFGMAFGVRRFHALMELTAAYEAAFLNQGSHEERAQGLVLTPAFALRLRI